MFDGREIEQLAARPLKLNELWNEEREEGSKIRDMLGRLLSSLSENFT